MKASLYVRELTASERSTLESGLRSDDGFCARRRQLILASAGREKVKKIAERIGCTQQTVRNVIHDFEGRGVGCLQAGSNQPLSVEPILTADKRKRLQVTLRYLPSANQMLLRFVEGRPLSVLTCTFLAWLAALFTAKGKRALFLIWGNATWHKSNIVRTWVKEHNRLAKQQGTCRLIICPLPSKSPWLNPIEPKWLHGKWAMVEPVRTLTTAELLKRVCDYYQSDLLDAIAK